MKIEKYLDKWSDEEKEAVCEAMEAAAFEAAKIAIEKYKSTLNASAHETETTDSK